VTVTEQVTTRAVVESNHEIWIETASDRRTAPILRSTGGAA
jgi:hypothetical protein